MCFRPLTPEANIERVRLPKQHIQLQPVAFLCRTLEIEDEGWVAGIVVKNPFRGMKLHVGQAKDGGTRIPAALNTSALLVCSLRSWHELGDQIDYYYMSSLEFVETYGTTVLYPVVDWESAQIDGQFR